MALHIIKISLMVQMVNYLPAMQETQIQFLSWEDPLEKGMATHSSILAWEGHKELDMTELLSTHKAEHMSSHTI